MVCKYCEKVLTYKNRTTKMIYHVNWRCSKKLQSDLSTSKNTKHFFKAKPQWRVDLQTRSQISQATSVHWWQKKWGCFLLLKMKAFWLQVNSLEPKSSVPSRPNCCQTAIPVFYWETNSKVVQMYKGYLICSFVWHSRGHNECLSVYLYTAYLFKKETIFKKKITCRAFIVKQKDSFSFTENVFCFAVWKV